MDAIARPPWIGNGIGAEAVVYSGIGVVEACLVSSSLGHADWWWTMAVGEPRPAGTVTFLFTDIEGSTLRWEAEPEVMQGVLGEHDAVLRTAITDHGGWVFKHTGDGVCAAFSSPHAALEAAIAAQRRLNVPVRMGVVTGEATLRDDDYFGPALNRAARVMAVGHGGQVVVAASTAALVPDAHLVDLGEHRLRDLPGLHRLFQLRAEGLAERFPPLRTLGAVPGNLPTESTTLIGRTHDLAAACAAVRQHRLVTLTGVGGVGKTRLAIRAATDLASEFPAGAWLVELAAVDDPSAIPDVVANVLGVIAAPGVSMLNRVAEALAGKRALLVLDNAEHVTDAVAELVEAVLRRSVEPHVLVTSREGLRVDGEHLWLVPSLSVEPAEGDGAVELFVDRASSVVRDFDLGPDRPVVEEICRRLDGIPLAIELAAARCVAMTPADIRDRLGDRFRLLAGRRGLERHQTLRHAVQWSFDLLTEGERTVLRRAAVFAGGFNAAAARAVCGSDDLGDHAVLDCLESLVWRSMLTVERVEGHARYGMLETVRQFAEEQLLAAGESPAVRARHAGWYGAQLVQRGEQYVSPEQGLAVDWLQRDFDNLRLAFRWALDAEDVDVAGPIATFAALAGWWSFQRLEGVSWAEEVVPLARSLRWRELPLLLAGASSCGYFGNRLQDAIRYAEEAVALGGDPAFRPDRHRREPIFLATMSFLAGRVDPEDALREAVQHSGDPLVIGRSLVVTIRAGLDRAPDAALDPDTLVEEARAVGWPHSIHSALLARGLVHLADDPRAALPDLRESVAVADGVGDVVSASQARCSLALAQVLAGDTAPGLRDLRWALEHSDRGLNDVTLRQALGALVVVLERLGRPEPAATVLGWMWAATTETFVSGVTGAVDRVRAALGAGFEAHAARGRALTRVEVIRLAYDELEAAQAAVA